MSANAVRVARHAAKMRAQGKKKLSLWVTPEEERIIRTFLLNPQGFDPSSWRMDPGIAHES